MSDWNLNEVEVNTRNDEITSGEHELRIIKAEMKDTKAGTGQYINVLFGVKGEGTFFEKFNVRNPSEKAQLIGRQQLKNLLLALGMSVDQVGKFGVQNLIELEGCECRAKLKVEQDPTYGQQVHVTTYKSKNFTAASEAPKAQPATGPKSPF